MSNNNEMIDHAIGLLMMQNEEDAAQAIDNLRNELERVKGIASRRLEKIGALQLELAQIEDDPRRLEDSDDDELGREPRSHLENELADAQARIADLEALANNRLERIMNLLGAIDAKDFKTIWKDNELAAAVDPEQARVELGREPRSHLENDIADLRAKTDAELVEAADKWRAYWF